MLPESWCIEGQFCHLVYRKSAKKRIIVRPHPEGLMINAPAHLPSVELKNFLDRHKIVLNQLFLKEYHQKNRLPESILYLGVEQKIVVDASVSEIVWQGDLITLPDLPIAIQKQRLADIIYRQAKIHLPALLQHHAQQHQLYPTKIRLTRAKTFWGVCRQSSIALNWRLMMALPSVIDYVCLHELCHLRHANHSHHFWQMLNHLCPDVAQSKQWLSRASDNLFVLG